MSKTWEHYDLAARHHERAAHEFKDAAKYHEAEEHEKAAYHAYLAHDSKETPAAEQEVNKKSAA
jgi:hypothetical protein